MGSKTIFVANIPFDVSEEQLKSTFGEVGPVQSVEIKFDQQTGRSKGYAFVHYFDDLTAQSAVRNLHEVLVNGRNLRVELSTDEPAKTRGGRTGGPGGGAGGQAGQRMSGPPTGYGPGYGGGPGGPPGPGGMGMGAPMPPVAGAMGGHGPPGGAPGYGGPGVGGGYGPPGGRDGTPPVRPPFDPAPAERMDLGMLPPGQDVPPGMKATDVISKTLAAIQPGQMQEVMAGMKTLVSTQPDQARQLLQSKPQLAYALFQAMLLMNIVDPSVLQRITPLPPTHAPPSAQGPPGGYPSYPPSRAPAPGPPNAPPAAYPGYPPQPQLAYRPPVDPRYAPPQHTPTPQPPPQSQAIPPAAMAALATLPEDQRTMLVQVLSMTPDQIAGLDSQQQASVMQLRQQFLS